MGGAMTEVRFRADGPSASVGAVDAFKVTRTRGQLNEWRVVPLYPWARAMLAAHRAAVGDAQGSLWDARIVGAQGGLAFSSRANALDYLQEAASWARSWQP